MAKVLYTSWNEAIASEFFSGQSQAAPVYLDLEADALDRIAKRAGEAGPDPKAALVAAVRLTLDLEEHKRGVFAEHLEALRDWQGGDRSGPPPCIALLAVFSLAAETMVGDEELRANNFYGRLARLLDTEEEHRLTRHFQRYSLEFWDALNSWLSDADGEIGLPTAEAFDRRRFVSVPISQALLREQDRRRLPGLFEKYGLAPGQRVSEPYMVELLRDWIGDATRTLRRLWDRGGDIRNRIASIACLELEAWDGAVPDASGDARSEVSSAKLRLLAEMRMHPLPSIHLDLSILGRTDQASGFYGPAGALSSSLEAGISGCTADLRLERIGSSSWLVLEPRDQMSLPDLLFSRIELVQKAGQGFRVHREPRFVIPLRFRAEDHAFVEVDCADLLERHLVLAHERLASAVNAYLEDAARPGYQRFEANELTGLPAEWVLFSDVELVSAGEADRDELSSLAPSRETHLSAGAGLFLQRGTWHVRQQPEIKAAGHEHAELRIETRSAVLSGKGEGAEVESAPFSGVHVHFLRDQPLGEGDYRLVLVGSDGGGKDEDLASLGVRIRSANAPLPRETQSIRPLEHALRDNGWSVLSAVEQGLGGATSDSCAGAVLSPEAIAPALAEDERLPTKPSFVGGLEIAPGAAVSPQARASMPTCLERGYHVFRCPSASAVRKKASKVSRRIRCTDCGHDQLVRRPRPRTLDGEERGARRPIRRSARVSSISEARPDLDLILDALSYLRGGTWGAFEQLARQASDETWFPINFARTLSALGHLDLELDRVACRPRRWRMAPPTLVELRDGTAVLAGERSERLLVNLSENVRSLGGDLALTTPATAPSRVMITGLDREALSLLAAETRAADGRELALSFDLPLRLMAALPSLDAVVSSLHEVTWRSTKLELYELSTGRWREVLSATVPGAYRFHTRPWTYAFLSHDATGGGRFWVADVRTVKCLASRDNGFSIVGYEPDTALLTVPTGAQLPGLVDRAATLCSGLPAQDVGDGLFAYGDVPHRVASQIGTWLTARTVAAAETRRSEIEYAASALAV